MMPTAASRGRQRASSPPPTPPQPLTFTDGYGRPRPADTSHPPQPSNLELFVCQRVSAELQPLLDGWRDAVRLELHAVREASADAAEWREAVSAELSELRSEQERGAESLGSVSKRLAEAPPSRLQKKLEMHEETMLTSLKRLQELVGDTRQSFERAEQGSTKEKRALVKALQEEKALALAASARELEHAERRGAELEDRLSAAESAAKAAARRASEGEERIADLQVALEHAKGQDASLRASTDRLEEMTAAKRASEALLSRQALHCSLLGEALAEAERDDLRVQKAALEDAHRAAASIAEKSARHEERRSRSHQEWLEATREVVPKLAEASDSLIGRLDAATQKAEGSAGALDGWRGRALQAEAARDESDRLRAAAEAEVAVARAARAAAEAEALALRVDVRCLSATVADVEVEAPELRRREHECRVAARENAEAVASLADIHSTLTGLAADVLAPMRVLEVDAVATALRDADALSAAREAGFREAAIARDGLLQAEAAWREERLALTAARESAAADARVAFAEAARHGPTEAEAAVQVAILKEKVSALTKELHAAREAAAIAGAEREEAMAAIRSEVVREREAALAERKAHAEERETLAAHTEAARAHAARSAEEMALAVARAQEEAREELAIEREAAATREAAAAAATESARQALEAARAEAADERRRLVEAHAHELTKSNDRVGGLAKAFEDESARQRERYDALVVEAKAQALAEHQLSLRAAAEQTAAAEAKLEAAEKNARLASEHHQSQLRSLAREHASALRAERQLASQELSAARERAEDAERRLDMARHDRFATNALLGVDGGGGGAWRSACGGGGGGDGGGGGHPALASGGAASAGVGAAAAAAALVAAAGGSGGGAGGAEHDIGNAGGEQQWEGMRRQQAELSAAHARRLSQLSGAPGSAPGTGLGGASAALLRRAMLSEAVAGTPRTRGAA